MKPSSKETLPAVPGDVTASWVAEKLGQPVAEIKLTRTIHSTASKLFFSITYEDADRSGAARPSHICIKGGFDPNILAAYPFITAIHRREANFYARIAPTLPRLKLPKCWWAGEDGKQGIVVMDDLDAQNCKYGDPVDTWPVDRVLAAVEQLAALHAGTWGVKPEHHPWLTSDYDKVLLALMETYDEVVNGDDRPPVPAYLRDQGRMATALAKHYRTHNPLFRCLVHGDAHTGNTYYAAAATAAAAAAPRFLDWQVVHVGSAFHDVSCVVGSALSVGDRRARERDVVAHYLGALARHGGPDLSGEEFREAVWTEYRKCFLVAVGWIMCPYVMQTRERVAAMAMRYATALDDHKVLELVESMAVPE